MEARGQEKPFEMTYWEPRGSVHLIQDRASQWKRVLPGLGEKTHKT
jgi:hypothetical protein